LIKTDSPLDRAGRRRAAAVKQTESSLSQREREQLKQIFAEPAEYMDDERFHEEDAYRKLFEEAPEVPAPNTSWYNPAMENLGHERELKSVVNQVLTAEQERTLFLQFNYARFKVAQIREQIGDEPATDEQARELLSWHRLADRLRDQIARSNLALVLSMAKRVRHSDVDFTDMISEGNMALLRAIDKFNVSRGFKFSTYACRAILKAFSRAGQKHTRYREMFPTDFDPALERSDHQRRRFDEHESDCADEVMRIVHANRAELSDVERQVISHRFALNREQHSSPLTLEQVGQIVGLTKERVRQIQNKALSKIRRTLEESYIDGTAEQEADGQPASAEDSRRRARR
jgi:RNA polymerase sigma factor (sigma-70 family)